MTNKIKSTKTIPTLLPMHGETIGAFATGAVATGATGAQPQ
ncbi:MULTISPECIES: hypothetical protein [Paenibacillus]|nr:MULTISPECIES: hypothetical protein [Paenibacillus]